MVCFVEKQGGRALLFRLINGDRLKLFELVEQLFPTNACKHAE